MRSLLLAFAVLLIVLCGLWWFVAARPVRRLPPPEPVAVLAPADSGTAVVLPDTRPLPPHGARAASPRRPAAAPRRPVATRSADRKPAVQAEAEDPALAAWRRQQIRTGNAEQALPCDSAEYWDEDKGVWKYLSYRFKQMHYVASRVMPRAPGVIEGRRGDSGPRNAY